MKKAIVYFDGGAYMLTHDKKRIFLATYGVVLHHGQDNPTEKLGEYQVSQNQNGHHEFIAFVEAFKTLKEQGLDYHNVSFYTDCESIAYANQTLHEQNYTQGKTKKISDNIKTALKIANMKEEYNEVMECLKTCYFVKVKGHDKIVDNIRADYLSKTAHQKKEPMAYDKFLECGFMRYNQEGLYMINLPFMPYNNKTKIMV